MPGGAVPFPPENRPCDHPLASSAALDLPLRCARPFQRPPRPGGSKTRAAPEINALLAPVRDKHKLPALAAAVVSSKGLVAVGAVGLRKRGDDTAVTVDDQFHLGSDTKAMTATLIAGLVE